MSIYQGNVIKAAIEELHEAYGDDEEEEEDDDDEEDEDDTV